MLSFEQKNLSRIKGIGIDITPIDRIARFVERYDRKTLSLVFTFSEIDNCQSASNSYLSYAICFATKEAVGKAFGTGLVGINWNEIEVTIAHDRLTISLHGKAQIQASRRGIGECLASWLQWDHHVLVHVIAQ